MAGNKNTIDMSNGPLLGKLIRFAIPFMLTNLLNVSFSLADMIVVGRWGSSEAMAAIGSALPLVALVVNAFFGLSAGINVLAAQYFGARDSRRMIRLVHTSVLFSAVCGLGVMALGLALLHYLVDISGVPEELQRQAIIYLAIIFIGSPFIMVYSAVCAILRAVGDSKSPLYFLIFAGIINVLLNVFLVVVCHLEVSGVALSTVASHLVCVSLGIRRLRRSHGATRLILKNLRFDIEAVKGILKIGVPAGLQTTCFSLSNTVIQSGINTFGVTAVAGITASHSIETILYSMVYSMHFTALAAVGQNYGAKKFDRLKRTVLLCTVIAFLLSTVGGWTAYLLSDSLLSIFTEDKEVILWGTVRARSLFTIYFLLALMDVASGALRGLGNSLAPAVSTFLGTCILRIWWVKYLFPHYKTLDSLLFCYPVSWGLVAVINYGIFIWLYRKKEQENGLIKTGKTKWFSA